MARWSQHQYTIEGLILRLHVIFGLSLSWVLVTVPKDFLALHPVDVLLRCPFI